MTRVSVEITGNTACELSFLEYFGDGLLLPSAVSITGEEVGINFDGFRQGYKTKCIFSSKWFSPLGCTFQFQYMLSLTQIDDILPFSWLWKSSVLIFLSLQIQSFKLSACRSPSDFSAPYLMSSS